MSTEPYFSRGEIKKKIERQRQNSAIREFYHQTYPFSSCKGTIVNGRYLDYYRSKARESDALIIVSTPGVQSPETSFSITSTDQGVALSFGRRYLADVYESGFVRRTECLTQIDRGTSTCPRVGHEPRRRTPRSNGCLFHLPPFSRTLETFSTR